ncbi:MAG: glycosyltransferase family 4 protein [Nitrospirales bacterium]|nr:glycosyltransferase family 4 protein [Nitrospirales bacterium]
MSRIVFINRYFYPDHSATSQLLGDLAFEFVASGHNVYVITSQQRYDQPNALLPAQEIIHGVTVHRVWTSKFGRANLLFRAVDYLAFYLSAGYKLLGLASRGDIIIAKTDPPLISVVAAVVTKIRGAKLICWIQDLFPEVAGALGIRGLGVFENLLRFLRNWSLRAAYKNVVIGDIMATKLTENNIPPAAIKVIHNWADGRDIQPIDREKNHLRRQWNLSKAMFVVGYSGNIGRAHEFDTILDTAEKLKNAVNIVFLFIGGGAQRIWIETEARERSLENIRFKSYQPREQLAFSLSVPDVHLISLQPTMEGLIVPSKFYGVAAAGRPTIFIGNKNGEIPRILQEGQCGFSVESGQASEVSRIIHYLADDLEARGRMGRRARTVFDQRFEVRHAKNAWKAVIESTANTL